jgi:hypothetical protein
MKSVAGPAMLLVIFGGFAVHQLTGRGDTPARDFTGLELAAADPAHTGTCYALDTVLLASTFGTNAVSTWTRPDADDDDRWTLRLENVQQGPNGPAHVFQEFSFRRIEDMIRLVNVEASGGISEDLRHNIDALLQGPHTMNSTPVERCQVSGATGYQFASKK